MHKFVFTFFLFFIIFISSCEDKKQLPEEKVVEVPVPKFEYGINIDSLLVVKDIVKKNEFLADILLRHGVNYDVIDYIARNTRDTFDVRKIRAGNKYAVIFTNDSIRDVLYFIYEISPSNYVRYSFSDSIYVERDKKQIIVSSDTISGTINSSLWNALVEGDGDPNLANELSEIYAWTIDFFGLRKGDEFQVIYDQLFVDGQYVGLGKIEAAKFTHMGKPIYAFYFEQNEKGDYFDDEGNSLQRTFLKAPLRYTRISSGFSNSRMHPVLKIRRPHHGVDYAAASGTPVYTVGDGVVVKKGYQKRGGGNYIKIKHNGTYSTTYMHLKGYARGMAVGKHVKQGDLIGYVGATGLATGPHLDFRFYRNGKAVNPLKVESPPSLPIDTTYRSRFDSVVVHYVPLLDSIN